MERTPRVWAQVMAAAGAGVLLLSLWLHWYTLRIPGAMIDRAVQLAGHFGILGSYVDQAAQALRQAGPIHVSAWQVFGQTDIVLAILAAVSGTVCVLMLSGRTAGAGGLVALCGVAASLLAGYRIVSPPGPDGILDASSGAYLALAAGAAMVLGGLLAEGTGAPVMATWQMPSLASAAPAAPTTSVPPPRQ